MRLRQKTTLWVNDIAARLQLATPGSASVCRLAARHQTPVASSPKASLDSEKRRPSRGLTLFMVRDYETKTENAEAMIHITMMGLMLRRLA